jgi:16S rRNA (guanine527-N7)-methyltransferase
LRLGLVSPNDVEHVITRHSADSLLFALVRRPGPGERWVDVGSGAGFPGVVLACCFPECSFTLAEPLQKRAGFLELAAADLGLANVDVLPARLQDLGMEPFDVAVARALTEPSEALRSMLGVVRPGGEAIVAISRDTAVDLGATTLKLEDLGNVDSPGVFSMMTREG